MKHLLPSPLLKRPLATDATAGLFKRLRQTPPALWRSVRHQTQDCHRAAVLPLPAVLFVSFVHTGGFFYCMYNVRFVPLTKYGASYSKWSFAELWVITTSFCIDLAFLPRYT